jgi:hypothetical protein
MIDEGKNRDGRIRTPICGDFRSVPECRGLTGVEPTQARTVEAHADFVAWLLVP